jgi:tetratricopeptide (TPR) repeat protein
MQPPMLNSLIRSIFLGFALVATLSGCSTKAQRANDAYGRAQQLIANGDIAGARRELLKAVAARDDLPDIWVALGQTRLAAGEMPEAFTAFSRADELRPGDVSTLRPLAYSGYMIGATQLSQDATDRLLALAPGDPQGLAVKGLLALDKGETATTMEAAEAILATTPNDDTGIMLKARAMAVGGKVDDAVKLLEDAMRVAGPKSGIAMSLLQFYRAKGDSAGMESVFPSLIAAQKDNAELALDYSNLLYRTGKTDAARKIWSDAVLANPNDGQFIAWAFNVYDNAEPGDKPTMLDERIMRFGPSPLHSATGQLLISRKEFARAIAFLTRGGSTADADRGLYAVALDGIGKRAEAEAIVNNILDTANARQDPNALMLRARWALQARNFDLAKANVQNSILADPTNFEARLLLARAYSETKQPERVRQVLAQAVRDLPRSRRPLVAYVQFLESIGDQRSAVSAARNFADANRSQPWSWGMLATTCDRASDGACATTARQYQQTAMRDLTFENPSRPFKLRGLFSPLSTSG